MPVPDNSSMRRGGALLICRLASCSCIPVCLRGCSYALLESCKLKTKQRFGCGTAPSSRPSTPGNVAARAVELICFLLVYSEIPWRRMQDVGQLARLLLTVLVEDGLRARLATAGARDRAPVRAVHHRGPVRSRAYLSPRCFDARFSRRLLRFEHVLSCVCLHAVWMHAQIWRDALGLLAPVSLSSCAAVATPWCGCMQGQIWSYVLPAGHGSAPTLAQSCMHIARGPRILSRGTQLHWLACIAPCAQAGGGVVQPDGGRARVAAPAHARARRPACRLRRRIHGLRQARAHARESRSIRRTWRLHTGASVLYLLYVLFHGPSFFCRLRGLRQARAHMFPQRLLRPSAPLRRWPLIPGWCMCVLISVLGFLCVSMCRAMEVACAHANGSQTRLLA